MNESRIFRVFEILRECEITSIVVSSYSIIVYFKLHNNRYSTSLYIDRSERYREHKLINYNFYINYDWDFNDNITNLLKSKNFENKLLGLHLLMEYGSKNK